MYRVNTLKTESHDNANFVVTGDTAIDDKVGIITILGFLYNSGGILSMQFVQARVSLKVRRRAMHTVGQQLLRFVEPVSSSKAASESECCMYYKGPQRAWLLRLQALPI